MAILAWPFPTGVMMWFARGWAAGAIYLHELITGASVEIRGAANLPEGPILVAAKHHSAWETMALLLFVPRATYILKRELLAVPLFGWHLRRAQQIAIDRSQKAQAMATVAEGTKLAIRRGRQIMIFPEGTRRSVGAEPAYRQGVARIYAGADVPCVPVAMTSGLAWPRNTLLHYPKRIIVEFLPVIPPGLAQEAFFARLQSDIENATNRLLAEAGYRPANAGLSQANA
jgi:1-acyl-sn-glycerol-3-phosphate acyltransferase